MPADKHIQKLIYKTISDSHPEFSHTNALYLDLEDEKMLNLFWPQKSGGERFKYLSSRNSPLTMDNSGLDYALKEFGINNENLRWVVVFSSQNEDGEPKEKTEFYEIFRNNFLKNSEWINLHFYLRETHGLKRYIRDTNYSRKINRKRTDYNLENLEEAFGIERPINLCSHNHEINGQPGGMHILTQISKWQSGQATNNEIGEILKYCKFDVESMFKVIKKSYKLN